MPDFVPTPTTFAQPTLLLNGEKLFSPAALAKASNLPGHRGGAHVNSSTIFRYIARGVLDATGRRVRLEAVRVGGRWLSSLEALTRFSRALTEASLPDEGTRTREAKRTPRQTTRAAAAASKELAAALRVTR